MNDITLDVGIPHKIDSPISKYFNHIILIVHGGCFVHGNENYDQTLSKFLTDNGYATVRVRFRTTSLHDSIIDLAIISVLLDNKFPNIKKSIIGISSGGYLALKLLSHLEDRVFNNYIGICPVLNPYLRHQTVTDPKILESQLKYFGSIEDIQRNSGFFGDHMFYDVDQSLLIIAKDDQNVPLSTLENLTNTFSTVKYFSGGHELCQYPPKELCQEIVNFIK